VKLLLLGAPGAGKGTQGARLSAALDVPHVAAGDVLRTEVARRTDTGRRAARFLREGDLVPDDVVLGTLTPALVAAVERGGYILDGFPRTLQQAHELDAMGARLGTSLDVAVWLEVPPVELVDRLAARASIERRSDDTPEVIARRLDVFAAVTQPVIEHYRGLGLLVTVDGSRSMNAITADILSRLGVGLI
jgi:adenylate kinase